MSGIKRGIILLLALLLFAGAFASCKKSGELKKGVITAQSATYDDCWQPLTSQARGQLEQTYQQKLAATQAFAQIPAVSGKTYYISSIHGNDSNAGTSPQSAWKSPEKANDANIREGDAVLFECGSVFRRTTNSYFFKSKSGVVYGTYGSGEKPIFYGSIKISAKQWTPVDGKKDLYYYDGGALFIGLENDIGSIVFNDGEAWGIKIQMLYNDPEEKQSPMNKTLALEDVSNGLETFSKIESYSLTSGKDLTGYDLSFYHDFETHRVYLYCKGGNPGVRFRSVELCLNSFAMQISKERSNVTFLNLDFRYFGSDAIHPMGCKNVVVRNCSFYFLGGTIQLNFGGWRNYETRLGNAVTNYGGCNGLTVENCFFDQIYDTAVSTQIEDNQISKNVSFRNNVMQNVWFGVELWAGKGTIKEGLEFSHVDVSGNYCRKIGEGLCTTRPDKVDPGTDYSVNAFIKVSRVLYQMKDYSVTDNIAEGSTGKFVYCSQPKTNANQQNGALFARNTYVGTRKNDFIVLPSAFPTFNPTWDSEAGKYQINVKKYPYSRATVDLIQSNGFETDSVFYYSDSADSWDGYVYKAANKVELPFRLILPDSYDEDKSYPLITFLNQESASGTDNLLNAETTPEMIAELTAGQNAIVLIPQCPSGTWTGLGVNNGNYDTAKVAESKVMQAVAALIRDVAAQFGADRNYAVGIDAGAYAVGDLLVRHKDLLAAGILVSGAGDPSADIGIAEAWIIHAGGDNLIPSENAAALADAWGAKYTFYEYGALHNCWEKAIREEDLLSWLLSK